MQKISVIIVNYNVKDFLNNAIESIQKSLLKFESEIIVVDNNSTDGSCEFVKTKFPNINLIENKKNVGFGIANNQALSIANGDFFVIINPDTIVEENTFKKLVDFFSENENAGMVGCKVLNPDGTLQLACRRSFPTPWIAFTKTFGLSSLFPNSKIFAKYNLTFLNENKVSEVDAISGSFMMIRKKVYEDVGGFDESFFMYGEDLDFCFRIKNNGWKIFYAPTTSIIHYKGESTKRSDINEMKVFYSAMKLYFQKHNKSTFLFGKIIECGIITRQAIGLLGKIFKSILSPLIDSLLVLIFLLISEFIRKGRIGTYPEYAYPMVYIVPILIVLLIQYLFNVYSIYKLSVVRSFVATILSFLIISSLTAFIKDFAFSRLIILISFLFLLIAIPGWRFLFKLFSKSTIRNINIFKSNTIIVGTNDSALKILNYLKLEIKNGFRIVGCLADKNQDSENKLKNIDVLGNYEMIEQIILHYKITEVLIAKDSIPIAEILKLRSNKKLKHVNFRLTIAGDELISISNIHLASEFPIAPFILKKSSILDKLFN